MGDLFNGMRLVVVLALSFGATQSWAATYYVDNAHAGAKDANPGTQAAPWERCPGMPGWTGTKTLQPGDTVLFHSKGTWEVASGDAIIQVTGGVTYDGRSWGGGTRAMLRATGDLNRSVINFREDHATQPTVVRGFEVDANSRVTTGIGVNWPQAAGSLTGATKRIEDCLVHHVSSQSASGEYEYGIVVSSGYGGNMKVENVEILSCEAHDISRGGINIYSANDDPKSQIKNVLVRGCTTYNTGQDPKYGGSSLAMKNHIIDVTVEFNHVHDTKLGAGIGVSSHTTGFRGPENAIIRHNIVRKCEAMGVVLNVKGDLSIDIYGNLILENTYQGIRFMGVQDNLSVGIYNNTLVHNHHDTWSHEILIDTTGATVSKLELKNNLIVSDKVTVPIQDDTGSITAHANNLLHRDGGGTLAKIDGKSYDDATVGTWEASAVTGDPKLEDISKLPTGFVGTFGVDLRPSPDGLSIDPSSPATDKGAALASPYATSINSVPRPAGPGWDIGAYEFTTAPPTPDSGTSDAGTKDGTAGSDGAKPGDGAVAGDTGGAGDHAGSAADDGCSCVVPGRSEPPRLMLLALLCGLGLLIRKRRANRLLGLALVLTVGVGCHRDKAAVPATSRPAAIHKEKTQKKKEARKEVQKDPVTLTAADVCEKHRKKIRARKGSAPVVTRPPTIGGSFWEPILVTQQICIARIKVAGYRISGNAIHPVLLRIANRNRTAIRECVSSLSDRAAPQGEASVTLKISAAGKITSWKVDGDAMAQPSARCLAKSLAATGFIPPNADDKGTLELTVAVQ